VARDAQPAALLAAAAVSLASLRFTPVGMNRTARVARSSPLLSLTPNVRSAPVSSTG